jgi:hypothetical protein
VLLNPKGSILWPDLDINLVSSYHAKAGKTGDRIDKFVFSWIVINHYCSLWSIISPNPSWGIKRKAPRERDEFRHFATIPAIANNWNNYIKLHNVCTKKILLPLFDRKGNNIPQNLSGETFISQLTIPDYLDVLYQLRCDFFHGERGIRGFDNEMKLWFAADPCYELTKYLIKETAPNK